jgi:hypothetical protein
MPYAQGKMVVQIRVVEEVEQVEMVLVHPHPHNLQATHSLLDQVAQEVQAL